MRPHASWIHTVILLVRVHTHFTAHRYHVILDHRVFTLPPIPTVVLGIIGFYLSTFCGVQQPTFINTNSILFVVVITIVAVAAVAVFVAVIGFEDISYTTNFWFFFCLFQKRQKRTNLSCYRPVS